MFPGLRNDFIRQYTTPRLKTGDVVTCDMRVMSRLSVCRMQGSPGHSDRQGRRGSVVYADLKRALGARATSQSVTGDGASSHFLPLPFPPEIDTASLPNATPPFSRIPSNSSDVENESIAPASFRSSR